MERIRRSGRLSNTHAQRFCRGDIILACLIGATAVVAYVLIRSEENSTPTTDGFCAQCAAANRSMVVDGNYTIVRDGQRLTPEHLLELFNSAKALEAGSDRLTTEQEGSTWSGKSVFGANETASVVHVSGGEHNPTGGRRGDAALGFFGGEKSRQGYSNIATARSGSPDQTLITRSDPEQRARKATRTAPPPSRSPFYLYLLFAKKIFGLSNCV